MIYYKNNYFETKTIVLITIDNNNSSCMIQKYVIFLCPILGFTYFIKIK